MQKETKFFPVDTLNKVVSVNQNKKDIKGHRWMPWLVEAMKDVLGCEKPRGAAKKL